MNKQQQRAISHLLQSRDQVMLVRGAAGTGKTTLLRQLGKQLEARGHKIMPLASTADASRNTLRNAGFSDADTIASFLNDPKRQNAARNGVLWVDEAGMIGTPTMLRLLQVAKRVNCRVIICGDTRQHSSVERGDALRLLETLIGLIPAELTEVVRQQGTYKHAVESLHKGEYDKGIQTLDKLGAIKEVQGKDWTPLVFEYIDAIKAGRTSLVISPTHAQGDDLTTLIRASLQREGKIGGDERLIPQLRDLRWTAPEREDANRYEPGQMIVFHRSARSGLTRFAPGERYEVVGRDAKGRVRMKNERGEERDLPLHRSKSFGVCESRHLRVSVGDSIRATANGRSTDGRHRINNNAVFRVAGFAPSGNLLLDNGWEVDREFGRMDHAYVSTSPSAQGRTVDHVFISQSAASLGASSAEQLYVSVSRGKHGVSIYTDDRNVLVETVSKSGTRTSAVELAEGKTGPKRSQERASILARLRLYEQERKQSREQNRNQERGYGR